MLVFQGNQHSEMPLTIQIFDAHKFDHSDLWKLAKSGKKGNAYGSDLQCSQDWNAGTPELSMAGVAGEFRVKGAGGTQTKGNGIKQCWTSCWALWRPPLSNNFFPSYVLIQSLAPLEQWLVPRHMAHRWSKGTTKDGGAASPTCWWCRTAWPQPRRASEPKPKDDCRGRTPWPWSSEPRRMFRQNMDQDVYYLLAPVSLMHVHSRMLQNDVNCIERPGKIGHRLSLIMSDPRVFSWCLNARRQEGCTHQRFAQFIGLHHTQCFIHDHA